MRTGYLKFKLKAQKLHFYSHRQRKNTEEKAAMALRSIQANDDRLTRLPIHGKQIKPRVALRNTSNLIHREPSGKAALQKPLAAFVKPTLTTAPVSTKDIAPTSKEHVVEEMEVAQVATQLSKTLHIEDIDCIDADNPQLCAEYAKEIYEYMRDLEKKYHVPPTYMQRQPHINSRMRVILIDWLIQVHLKFNLLQETLYLTVSIIDRYLAHSTVHKSKLQLVGVTAMLIASKYEEMYAPEVRDFVFITDETYKAEVILNMEREMLQALDYSFGTPLCLHFLRRYSRAGQATPEMHTMAKFLMELCLPDYSMLEFHTSMIAAAALYVSMQLYGAGEWNATLQHYSTYSKGEIMPCACKIAKLVLDMPMAKHEAVKKKYASSTFLNVSKVAMRKSKTIQSLISGGQ